MIVAVTGGSKGIGKAIAHRYAAANATVLIGSRGETNLYNSLQELQTIYPQATVKAKPADFSLHGQVADWCSWVLQNGVPDILVNNAGQFIPGSIHTEAEGVLEAMLQQNLLSAYYVTRQLLPAMMEKKSGHIFNICSIASIQAYPNGGAYSISKHALLGFSRNLREEMKPYNIRVTSVMPGAAYTDSWAGSGVDPKRIIEAGDIASMVFAAGQLGPGACVEDIVLRPQLGDL